MDIYRFISAFLPPFLVRVPPPPMTSFGETAIPYISDTINGRGTFPRIFDEVGGKVLFNHKL